MRKIFFLVVALFLFLPAACKKQRAAPPEQHSAVTSKPQATVGNAAWNEPAVTGFSYRRAWNESAGELFDIRWSFDRGRPFEIDVEAGDITIPASQRGRFGQAESGPMATTAEVVRALDLIGGRLEEKRRRAVSDALAECMEAHASFDIAALSEPEAKLASILSEIGSVTAQLYLLQNHPMGAEFEHSLIRAGDTDSIRFFRRSGGPYSLRYGDKLYASAVRSFPDRMVASAMWPDGMNSSLLAEFAGRGEGAADLFSPFTVVKRTAAGDIITLPYSTYPPFASHLRAIERRLDEASEVEGIDPTLKEYLGKLSEALRSPDPRPFSEALDAWVKANAGIEIIAGPFGEGRDPFGVKNFFEFIFARENPKGGIFIAKILPLIPEFEALLAGLSGNLYTPRPIVPQVLRAVDVLLASGFASGDSGPILEFGLSAGGPQSLAKKLIAVNHHEALAPLLGKVAQETLTPALATQVDAQGAFMFTALRSMAKGIGPRVKTLDKDDAETLAVARDDAAAVWMAKIIAERGLIGESDLRKIYAAWLAILFDRMRMGVESSLSRASLSELSYLSWHGAIREQGARFAIVSERIGQAMEAMLKLIIGSIESGTEDGAAEFLSVYPSKAPDGVAVALSAIETAGVPRGVFVYYNLTGVNH